MCAAVPRGYREAVAWRRRPWWHYLIGAYFGYVLIVSVVVSAWTQGWVAAAATVVTQAVALGSAGTAIRRGTRAVVALVIATAAGLAATALDPYAGFTFLYLVIAMTPWRMRLLWASVFAMVVTAAFTTIMALTSVPGPTIFGIASGAGCTLCISVLVRQLSVVRRQTAAVAQARASEAVMAERQRLAREIHDVLAHSLSGQVLYLEGTRLLLEHGGDNAVVLERVTKATDLARAGLEDAKHAVQALRGEAMPLIDQLTLLAAEFRMVAGNPCTVSVRGDQDQVAPQARITVLRTIQEALTNVRKHAPAAEVAVALTTAAGWCELEVRDTGGGSGQLADTGNGYGLVGMRERAELIGGSLEAGPDGQGFRVLLRVPA
jgi:signal transduction histidine kinase